MTERIAVGVIRRPHGVRGEASVEPWTDSIDRLSELEEVVLVSPDESRTLDVRVQAIRSHGERALMKFDGLDTPEAIQALQSWTIEIPEKLARTLDADEYFLHDLVGLTLVDTAGNERGNVVDAYEGGSGVLLNVRRADGRTFELPFAADLCTEIDLEAKRITVSLPEGIDDLESVEE